AFASAQQARNWYKTLYQKHQDNQAEQGGARAIGQNRQGQTLYEDANGVRSIKDGVFNLQESVDVVPGQGAAVDVANLPDRFKTVDELVATMQASEQDHPSAAAPQTAAPAQSTENYGANHNTFTKDADDAARERLLDKLGRLYAGFHPEL